MEIINLQKFTKWNIKQNKRLIVLLILLFGFGSKSVNGQSEKSNYFGINVFPLIGNTLELGYELNIKPNFSIDLYSGYVFNSKLRSPLKKGTKYDLENKSGFFMKIGARYNLRSDLNKFAPFFGINIVNAMAIEKGVFDDDFDNHTPNERVVGNSYNLGLNGIIGITSSAIKRINIDLGLQVGKVVLNNLLDFHSYMPGMGVSFGSGLRVQGVLRVKYRLK